MKQGQSSSGRHFTPSHTSPAEHPHVPLFMKALGSPGQVSQSTCTGCLGYSEERIGP